MKITIVLLITLSFFLFNIGRAFSCSLGLSTIELVDKYHCNLVNFAERLNNPNLEINETSISDKCPIMNLTRQDRGIILKFVNDFNYSYGYIQRQSDNEYADFIDNMKKVNSDICNCQEIILYGRNGSWTAYRNTYKESCPNSDACYQYPPFFCPNSNQFLTFILISSIFVIVIIVLVISIIKEPKKIHKSINLTKMLRLRF